MVTHMVYALAHIDITVDISLRFQWNTCEKIMTLGPSDHQRPFCIMPIYLYQMLLSKDYKITEYENSFYLSSPTAYI